ncbi:hypothetical protein C8Q76DRAFT_690723 [Earliella scabrosa]|nr:hypothetical protein C8Q76DRAFT_690723 [Earliella scabrosa]
MPPLSCTWSMSTTPRRDLRLSSGTSLSPSHLYQPARLFPHSTPMAPGLPIALAFTAVQDFLSTIKSMVSSLDGDLESACEQFILPVNLARWAPVIRARASCKFEAFRAVATHDIDRHVVMLFEVTMGQGDLLDRLEGAVSAMVGAFEASDDVWQKFRMLYDGWVLRLQKTDSEVIEKALPELRLMRESKKSSFMGDVLRKNV